MYVVTLNNLYLSDCFEWVSNITEAMGFYQYHEVEQLCEQLSASVVCKLRRVYY